MNHYTTVLTDEMNCTGTSGGYCSTYTHLSEAIHVYKVWNIDI